MADPIYLLYFFFGFVALIWCIYIEAFTRDWRQLRKKRKNRRKARSRY